MTWFKQNWLPFLCLLGLLYVIYYLQFSIPSKLQKCNSIAITLEKTRHYPVDDLTVTNQDISSYMKNMINCLTD